MSSDWDAVFTAMRRCHEVVHDMGAVRISSTWKFGTRTDLQQTMQDKIDSARAAFDTVDPQD